MISAISKSDVNEAIFLSTNKNVAPVNVMEMTRALMEKLVSSYKDLVHKTYITRYENVIGTRGSEIPESIDSLRSKNEVTVTNLLMIKFLMSLSEFVDFVLHNIKYQNPRDLSLQMSLYETILTIYSTLSELMDITNPKVITIGSRPGKIIVKTLITFEEIFFSSNTDEFFRVPKRTFMQNYPSLNWTTKNGDYTSADTRPFTVNELMEVFSHDENFRLLIHGE